MPKIKTRPSFTPNMVIGIESMSMRTWQKNISLVLGLSYYATGAWASEFSIKNDFMAAQLPEAGRSRGITAQGLSALPPQSLDRLISQTTGQKLVSKPATSATPARTGAVQVAAAKAPAILVQSPKTKGELVKVELPKLNNENEDEIFAEARRFLDIDLPPPTDQLNRKLSEESRSRVAAQSQLGAGPRLVLQSQGEQLDIEPKSAQLLLNGEPLQVVYEGLAEQPHIFLRDSKRLRWDDKTRKLYGQAAGPSEVFITYRNQLYILPVEVREEVRGDLLTKDQKSLQKLTSVLPLKTQKLSYQGDDLIRDNARDRLENEPLSLAASEAEVISTREASERKQQRFVYPNPSPNYKTIGVQVLDERSLPEKSLIYPVSGVKVRLLGTPVVAETDAKGHAMFGEIPAGSRFWVLIEDEKGQTVPTVSELALPRSGKQEVLRARTISHRTFSAYMSIVDLAQDARLGSICGRAMQADGRQAREGIRVSINREADGPFYIGSFGPQKDLEATDKSGRFCFFNVQPGLAELSFFEGQSYQTSLSMPLFPGAHSEEDLFLEDSPSRRLYLAALPSANDQINEEQASLDLFQSVDFTDLIPIGENEAMARVSPGIVGHEAGYTNFKGRTYALSQAPEFENVFYALDRDKEWTRHMPVVPLLQRGFIEDLFHELNQQDGYSNVAFDQALGQVLVYHALDAGQAGVKISLINSVGQPVEDAWYFGNSALGATKAVFFNLQAGVYQVKVESAQGALLALDTLAVDFWTTAFVQTGSSVQLSLGYRREDEN